MQILLRPNRTKINQNLYALRSKILKREDFCSTKAQNTGNPVGLPSILTIVGRKSSFLKRVRICRLTLGK